MIRIAAAISLILAAPAAAMTPQAPPQPPAKPVEVMIVGAFHMSNPGHDLHNMQVPDVLAPGPQQEIAAIDAALARFDPTVVAAEWDAATVAELYPKYQRGVLSSSQNEVVQLGFRLAKQTGARMIGADADGEFPYAPVQAYAKAHGQQAILDQNSADTQAMVDEETRLVGRPDGITATLRYLNEPASVKRMYGFYADLPKIGGGAEQPGADLLSAWNHRNFLICANLVQAAKPGDRMVVFFGAGHAYLLRRCIAETPGFKLVEANAWLPK